MNCSEISERLGEYWDLPDHHEFRRAVDRHIAECEACREEFELWRESAALIQFTRFDGAPETSERPISLGVMERIYKDESWRLPVAFRSYTLDRKSVV